MNININDIKNGMTVIIDDKLCMILEFQHVKPGKGPAFVRMKFKNLKTGAIVEETFNTNIKLEKAHVDKQSMQYLYNQGDNYIFMNNNDYSQLEVSKTIVSDYIKFLKAGLEINITMFNGEIIDLELPEKIEYEITHTTEAVKGNTSGNAMKDATIETGYVVKVPLFISKDEKIIISTKDGKYVSRG